MRVLHTSFNWWFSRETDWQQVYSGPQDFSQYSGCVIAKIFLCLYEQRATQGQFLTGVQQV